jgi:hypothetical protein
MYCYVWDCYVIFSGLENWRPESVPELEPLRLRQIRQIKEYVTGGGILLVYLLAIEGSCHL